MAYNSTYAHWAHEVVSLTLCVNVQNAGVAAGSTRAALTLHFAKQNNAADVSAKEGTQVNWHATLLTQTQEEG